MPTYDYKCTKCGVVLEISKEIGDDRIPTCCNTSMERVWTSNPVIFKAGGFYSTGG